jgi:4-amino-4-deoxy-L-arabinose transferase-like glycosyltransferase
MPATDNKIKFPPAPDAKVIIFLIFLVALVVKLLIFYLVTDPIIFYKYPYFSEQIAQGKDIGERLVDISPLYLSLNLLSYYVYGTNWEALVLIQIIIGSLNCVLIYIIGAKVFNKTVGIISALLAMFYSNLTLIDLTLEPEAILIFFNSLIVLVALKAVEAVSARKQSALWLLTGLLMGLSIITKPNSLLVSAGVLIWLWLKATAINLRVKWSLVMLAGVIVVVAPVAIRNYVKFNDFVLVTADGGKVFFHGNGPGADGMGMAGLPHQGFIEEGSKEPDYAHVLFRKHARLASGKNLKPSECASFWVRTTLSHIKSNFPSWLYLELKKFCFFGKGYEAHDIDSNYKNYLALCGKPLIGFGVIALFGVIGMALSLGRIRRAFLLYWMILTYFATVMIFFASSRYRIPAAPFLAIFAAFAIHQIFDFIRRKKIKETGAVFICLFLLGAGSHYCFREEIAGYDRWQMATRLYYSMGGNLPFKRGRYAEARDNLKRAVALAPDFAPAYNNLLGKTSAILGDYTEAETGFLKVIELVPDLEEGYVNLGLLYKLQGDDKKAAVCLKRALEINPDNQKIKDLNRSPR